jgi:tetratricopeptide (TPR) repeat protein
MVMGIRLPDDKHLFRAPKRDNPIRIYFLVFFVLIGVFIFREVKAGNIQEPFLPTPTATRTANSFAFEGETHFNAGKIQEAVDSYRKAASLEPNNSTIWAELARIQTYSANLLTTDAQKIQRLQEAIESAEKAVELNPEDSSAHAILSLTYDWFSNPNYSGSEAEDYVFKAEQASAKALQLDSDNVLAVAFRAEIYMRQLRYKEALDFAERAVSMDNTSFDAYRVYGFVLESQGGSYDEAIEAYKKAAEINPNLTFIYLSIGVNYRQLQKYDEALEYFALAASINEDNEILDPIPYLGIARTYSQIGEFFIAARNVMRALEITPTDPFVYSQLGLVYFRSRNYEGSIPAFACAVDGCTALESCIVRQECSEDTPEEEIPPYEIEGLPLTESTVVYYYSYGSVLAAMHRDGTGYCERALDVFDTIRSRYADNDGVMSIVNTSVSICESYGITQ